MGDGHACPGYAGRRGTLLFNKAQAGRRDNRHDRAITRNDCFHPDCSPLSRGGADRLLPRPGDAGSRTQDSRGGTAPFRARECWVPACGGTTAAIGRDRTDRVRAVLAEAVVSAVNDSEVIAKLVERGGSPTAISRALDHLHLTVIEFDRAQAVETGALRQSTRQAGLSFGGRSCLALAKSRGLTALTADRAWAHLDDAVGITQAPDHGRRGARRSALPSKVRGASLIRTVCPTRTASTMINTSRSTIRTIAMSASTIWRSMLRVYASDQWLHQFSLGRSDEDWRALQG
ncbi:type II toxin-antitoxin system VapC family toxin [Methylobacterium sp. ID0610]|uniref:type II toxin-antitoxin system VapC family toxin n=1 Tax=Methylobacterium carpenticola TaxID=3344827 RepID=UPI0036D130C7